MFIADLARQHHDDLLKAAADAHLARVARRRPARSRTLWARARSERGRG